MIPIWMKSLDFCFVRPTHSMQVVSKILFFSLTPTFLAVNDEDKYDFFPYLIGYSVVLAKQFTLILSYADNTR